MANNGKMKTILEKRIEFGKVAYWGKQKRNMVDVTIEIRECGGEQIIKRDCGFDTLVGYRPTYTELSICGNIWNNLHTDIVCGGQCLDTIAEYIKTPLMQQIVSMWRRYHLNGMHAGTPEQESAAKRFVTEQLGGKYNYGKVVEYLKSIGMYEVVFTGKTTGRMYDHEPYKYGTAWIVEDLPEYVIKWAEGLEG